MVQLAYEGITARPDHLRSWIKGRGIRPVRGVSQRIVLGTGMIEQSDRRDPDQDLPVAHRLERAAAQDLDNDFALFAYTRRTRRCEKLDLKTVKGNQTDTAFGGGRIAVIAVGKKGFRPRKPKQD